MIRPQSPACEEAVVEWGRCRGPCRRDPSEVPQGLRGGSINWLRFGTLFKGR